MTLLNDQGKKFVGDPRNARRISSCFDLIAIASKHDGVVYGGFVRRVIVPIEFPSTGPMRSTPRSSYNDLLSNPRTSAEFDKLNIWFRTQDKIDGFLREMGELTEFSPIRQLDADRYANEVKMMIYHIHSKEPMSVRIGLVKSETFPLVNFDVDCLGFRIIDGQWKGSDHTGNWGENASLLAWLIIKKKATMLPQCWKHIANTPRASWDSRISLIVFKYLLRGWTVIINDEEFSPQDGNHLIRVLKELCERTNPSKESKGKEEACFPDQITTSRDAKSSEVPKETNAEGDLSLKESAEYIFACFNLIRVASRHNGIVFGEFVRKVLVPMTHFTNKSDTELVASVDDYTTLLLKLDAPVKCTRVDIWFKTERDIDAFTAETGDQFKVQASVKHHLGQDKCEYREGFYGFQSRKLGGVHLRCEICDRIPVDDFNVNCLGFKWVNDRWHAESYCSNMSPFQLCGAILNKTATMLPEYPAILNDLSMNYFDFINCKTARYFSDGWTLKIKDREFSSQKGNTDHFANSVMIIWHDSVKPRLAKLKELEMSTESKPRCPCCDQILISPNKPLTGSIEINRLIKSICQM